MPATLLLKIKMSGYQVGVEFTRERFFNPKYEIPILLGPPDLAAVYGFIRPRW